MLRIEQYFKKRYVPNQAQNIARFFCNIEQEGLVFCAYHEIADCTDLTIPTVIKYINELDRQEIIHIHRCTPYNNVYELIV